MVQKSNQMAELVDLICLVYHEARNVRHPIKHGRLSTDGIYRKLLNLAKNRATAWDQMAQVRDKAARAKTPVDAAMVFQEVYDLTLNDLQQLYRQPFWRHSPTGGNKWSDITKAVENLMTCMVSGQSAPAIALICEILDMRHNTGLVRAKLECLKPITRES